ncbi:MULTISPECIES: signal recognition particle-docking protein FtsY [Aminobacterium]|jgi:fused signal recognition particle receptor|uniref:signal recognition particle-docking protein FtsY n=1 Tax=Aminobacterium TaxID=81466 RepID=UPI0004668BF7|nr:MULTISPECIES: signal recognition particle-docking protein FtsY [Aminobacterium]
MFLWDKLKNGLKGVKNRWSGGLISLFSGTSIDDEFWEQMEELLISGDVGLDLTEELIESLQKVVKKEGLKTSDQLIDYFIDMLTSHLEKIEGMGKEIVLDVKPKVVVLVGVNGSGKTTTAAKLAEQFRRQEKKVVLGAADTFRAGAIEQLKIWGERTGSRVIAQQQGSDSAAVAYDALLAARASSSDLLIVDTAGRLHSKHNLMEELSKVIRVLAREVDQENIEILLVLDAVMGQNGFAQAQAFHEALHLTGVILSKYDNTAKGGIILAIAHHLGLPIRYVGLGEGVDDLRRFEPKLFVSALLERNSDEN